MDKSNISLSEWFFYIFRVEYVNHSQIVLKNQYVWEKTPEWSDDVGHLQR